MRWEKVQVNPIQGQGGEGGELSGLGRRWGHTCNAIKGGRFLYVFGGYGRNNCQTNQVHVFDTVKHTWSQPVMKGIPPTPRDSHSCTAVGDNLFVFGGTDGMNPLKDLHILDTSSHTWITPTIRGEGPEAREGHSAALVGKRLYIFGGCGKSADNNNEVYYNDLYILNTETFVWKCATTSGTPPSPRDSHTCSSWKNKVIMIGGEDGHDYYLSDVHILDTDTLIWRELNMSGQLLPARAGHSTVSLGKNLFVFGGFADAQNLYNDLYMLDVETGVWTKMAATGDGPSARFSVAGDCLDPCMGGVLVFVGGCNKSLEALDDMYYLYTGLGGESEQRPEKLSLRKQLKLKCQEQNLNPVQSQAPLRYGVVANISQPMTMLGYSQPSRQNIPLNQSFPPGKKMFQAKVTESISEGYTIETVIDGKPLRGILFLNRQSFRYPATHTTNRKRTADETGSGISNGLHPNKQRNSTVLKQDEMEERHTDGVHGHSSASHEHHPETVASLIPSNPKSSEISSSPVSEAVLLNQKNHNSNDSLKFLAENLENDGKNSVPSSKTEVLADNSTSNVPSASYEVPRYDQPSNAPSCNIEALKPAAVENVCLSSPGSTTPMTEERNEPAT